MKTGGWTSEYGAYHLRRSACSPWLWSHRYLKVSRHRTEPLAVNLSNGELDQTHFLEKDQGHVMKKHREDGS